MKKIGYTTGVFDMFHVGHLNILQRASLECNYLIVGITTDELAATKKGHLPIIPLQERMKIVESIQFVDEVVPQVNYNKLQAWEMLKFDKIFVGDDWKNSSEWNELEKEFNNLKVTIHYFPYTNTTSSTTLKKTLYKIHGM